MTALSKINIVGIIPTMIRATGTVSLPVRTVFSLLTPVRNLMVLTRLSKRVSRRS